MDLRSSTEKTPLLGIILYYQSKLFLSKYLWCRVRLRQNIFKVSWSLIYSKILHWKQSVSPHIISCRNDLGMDSLGTNKRPWFSVAQILGKVPKWATTKGTIWKEGGGVLDRPGFSQQHHTHGRAPTKGRIWIRPAHVLDAAWSVRILSAAVLNLALLIWHAWNHPRESEKAESFQVVWKWTQKNNSTNHLYGRFQ